MDNLNTHRLTTANPKRTRLDSAVPQAVVAERGDDQRIPSYGPTANPLRTTLMDVRS